MTCYQIIKHFYVCAALLTYISSFIYRLPCISYASFNLTPSKYIIGVINSTFIADSINDCGIYCVRSLDCIFANYNADLRICQLMSSIATSSNSRNYAQWTVLLTDYTSVLNIGPICENNTPCANLYCRDVCSTSALVHTYQCLASLDVSSVATPSLSSTLLTNNWGYLNAKNAVDGDVNTFAAANKETQSWLKLDLHNVYQVTQIIVYNRKNCCPERMNGNTLHLSVTDCYLNATKIATLNSDMEQNIIGLFVGRYVFVVKIPGDYFQIAEITVFV